jgi:branched-chain amino acid transport system substrate-binding protein
MENFIGIWWSGSENDVIPAAAGADGYKSLNMHNIGTDYPLYADLKTHVYDAGKAAGAGDQSGTVLYNRGLYAAMLAAEAAKKAQELAGHANITAAEMRDGMEALEITEATMAAIGMPDFGPAFSVNCANHGGAGKAKIQQWDADTQTWTILTDWIESDRSVIDPLIAEDSAAYAAEAGVTERCN